MKRWTAAGVLVALAAAAIGGAIVALLAGGARGGRTSGPGRRSTVEGAAAPTVSAPAPYPAFGLIGDAVLAGDGRAFLLDVMERRVGVLDAGGNGVAWTGEQGRGPGAFTVPVALAAGQGVLYVLDRGTHRIERYRTGRRLERDGGVVLEFLPEDLCVSRGRLFVLGAHRGSAIHEISLRDGRVLRSLAPDPQLADGLLATYRASGYLACEADALTFLPLLRPEVLRFSAATGALVARVPIPRYDAVHVRMQDGGVEFRAGGGTHHVGASVLPLRDGGALVQAGTVRQGISTPHEFTSVRSYRVDWGRAQARVVSDTLPWIADLRDGWALAVDTDPEPAVRRIRFSPLPGP